MEKRTKCQLKPGSRVDEFKVLRQVGRGGMGEVYVARDSNLGRKVALKIIHTQALGDQEAVDRFLHEARVTARFNHPHIVTIYTVGYHADMPYIALEFLDGQNLRDRLRSEKPSTREALRIGLAIAQALEEAHHHGVLHRDLKPENVFMPKDGRLRVLDFGLAKLVDTSALRDTVQEVLGTESSGFATTIDGKEAEAEAFESRKQGLRGTPLYMAPEQWKEEPAVEASDMWAFGVLLHEMLTGRLPYNATGVYGICLELARPEPLPTVASNADGLPQSVTSLIDACLQKAPADRPSASDAVDTLNAALEGPGPRALDEKSPFRGLLPFGERHSDLFFGRENEISSFLETLRDESLLLVVGHSGAGKSSFVRAGVIPRLREAGNWHVLRMRPGRQPLHTLAARLLGSVSSSEIKSSASSPHEKAPPKEQRDLTRLEALEKTLVEELLQAPAKLAIKLGQLAETAETNVLLFVDQLEELFTLVPDAEVRTAFLRAVCTAADDPEGPVRCVLTLRDDFLGRLSELAEAQASIGRVTVLRPLNAETLRDVLVKPLQLYGYRFEDDTLIDDMVKEVEGATAALPLLEFTCQLLWENRDTDNRVITRAAYEKAGGVTGALALHADGFLSTLTTKQERVARTLLLRLVSPDSTRQVLNRHQLVNGIGSEAEEVLAGLTRERAIIVRKGRLGAEYELVHESLIQNWDRLRVWLEESREDRIFLGEVGQAANLWEQRGRRDTEVWTGDALHEALRRASKCDELTDSVSGFLAAGRQRESLRVRSRRVLWASAASLLVLITVAALVASWTMKSKEREAQRLRRKAETQRTEAEKQRADAQREGAQAALNRGDFIEARAKLRSSLETRDSPNARALWWRLMKGQTYWSRRVGEVVYGVAFSPDGKELAVACGDNTVRRIDVVTGLETTLRGHRSKVFSIAFSPEGNLLASGDRSGEIRVWEPGAMDGRKVSGHKGAIWSLDFSPDGRLLASASDDQTVRLWDAKTFRLVRSLRGHNGAVRGVRFGRNGRLLASGSSDKTTRIWRVDSGSMQRLLRGHSSSVSSVSFNRAGDLLATASSDQTIRLWNVHDGSLRRVLGGHESAVWGVAFSADDKLLASGSYDGTVRLWRVASGETTNVLRGHQSIVWGIGFSPSSNRRLASGGDDKTVRIWRIPDEKYTVKRGRRPKVDFVHFSADGKLFTKLTKNGKVRLYSEISGRPVWRTVLMRRKVPEIYTHEGWVCLAEKCHHRKRGKRWRQAIMQKGRIASEDIRGKTLCYLDHGGFLEIWNLERDRLIARTKAPDTAAVIAVDRACITLQTDTVRRVDSNGHSRVLERKVDAIALAAGDLLVASGKRIILFSPGGKRIRTFSGSVHATALTRVGEWIAVGFSNGSIELYPVRAGLRRPRFAFEGMPASPVESLIAGPMDTLIAGYGNGVVGIWSLRNGELLQQDKLYGAVTHLQLLKGRLLAATLMGHYLVMSLEVFYRKYCDLLREVWRHTPIVWKEGLPRRSQPATGHRCYSGRQ